MVLELTPFHADLVWMTPLSPARAESLVAFLSDPAPADVLDVGCGWGELLLRVVEAAPAALGHGVDVDESAIAHGRSMAVERGLQARVRFDVADAAGLDEPAAAVVCIGASQTWGPPVEEGSDHGYDQPLDYASALTALRRLVLRSGRVVFGEAIWSSAPTEAAIAPLAGRLDEFVTLNDLLDLVVEHGFAVVACHEATLDEWDVFESGCAARYARWLAAHPTDHPSAAEVRERARRQRHAYLGGYRGVLGMAYLCLVAV